MTTQAKTTNPAQPATKTSLSGPEMRSLSDHLAPVLAALQATEELRECPQHGAYRAIISQVRGRTCESNCPACDQDAFEKEAKARSAALISEAREGRLKRLLGASGIPKRFLSRTFANYQAETAAKARVLKLVSNYTRRFDAILEEGTSLVLCGRPGTGKTHLACAAANEVLSRNHSVVFMTVVAAVRQVKDTYRRESETTETQAIERFVEPDLLILDEVGVQLGTDTEKRILFEILNGRYENLRPSILLTNLKREELAAYVGERIMDRLQEGGGTVLSLDWESYRKGGRG